MNLLNRLVLKSILASYLLPFVGPPIAKALSDLQTVVGVSLRMLSFEASITDCLNRRS